MALYVVESYDFSLEHGGCASQGVVPDKRGSEKIFLHVVPLTDAEIGKLAPRVDEDGNLDHARLALPRDESFWVAVDGEARWPKLPRPVVRSRCDLASGRPVPVALTEEERAALLKLGVKLP